MEWFWVGSLGCVGTERTFASLSASRLGLEHVVHGGEMLSTSLSEESGRAGRRAVGTGEGEQGGILRAVVELSKVPEHSSVAILELNVLLGIHVSPVGKAVSTNPVVATAHRLGFAFVCKALRRVQQAYRQRQITRERIGR